MRVLIYLEPLWFRGSPRFISQHLELHIAPVIRALSVGTARLEIAVVSNLFVCLDALKTFRALDLPIEPHLFLLNSRDLLQNTDFDVAGYCAAVFGTTGHKCITLQAQINELIKEFRPDIAVATSQNAPLSAACATHAVPLLSLEFGPLPRNLFPRNRFLSFDGHLSQGHFRSTKALAQKLQAVAANERQFNRLNERYDAFVQNHANRAMAETFFADHADRSIALLALQPTDWLTWEGALGRNMSLETALLSALDRMNASALIFTTHKDCQVSQAALSEIELTNPNLLRLPAALQSNSSEMLLPFVDEVVSVSSTVAATGFLLGKRITALGRSFVSSLAGLSGRPEVDAHRNALLTFFMNEYSVFDDVFHDPWKLRARLESDLNKSGKTLTDTQYLTRSDRPAPTDDLATLHRTMAQSDASPDDMLRRFGRHGLAYMLADGAIGAELGVAAGTFSETLLRAQRFQQLYLVDRWSDHHDEAEYKAVCDRLAPYNAARILRMSFDEALDEVPDETLDFLYIDGYAHTGHAADVLRAWRRKLKPGALVAGHDFCPRFWPENHARLSALFAENGWQARTVPGVFTFNSEDIFPSFAIRLPSTTAALRT